MVDPAQRDGDTGGVGRYSENDGESRWSSASCVSNGRISACTLPSTGVDRSAPGCTVNYYNVVVHRVVYQVVEPYLKDSGHS